MGVSKAWRLDLIGLGLIENMARAMSGGEDEYKVQMVKCKPCKEVRDSTGH